MAIDFMSKTPPKAKATALFDETFLRRVERMNFRTAPYLRGTLGGERRSRNLRPALDFSDHRLYTPGDDLRYVDWHSYARHDELFVKLGETTQSIPVHILVDCSRSMAWSPWQKADARTSNSIKWDSARRLAGAMGYLALSGGERVSITPFATELRQSFGPTQGKRQVLPVLQFLTQLSPALPPQETPQAALARILTQYGQTQPRGGLLLIISDLLDSAEATDTSDSAVWLLEGLTHLAPPRWQVMVMHLLSEQEIQPTIEGDFDLRDMETQAKRTYRMDEATLAQYRLRVKRWCEDVKQACHRRGATYARVLAEWPFEKAVVPYLRQRGMIH